MTWIRKKEEFTNPLPTAMFPILLPLLMSVDSEFPCFFRFLTTVCHRGKSFQRDKDSRKNTGVFKHFGACCPCRSHWPPSEHTALKTPFRIHRCLPLRAWSKKFWMLWDGGLSRILIDNKALEKPWLPLLRRTQEGCSGGNLGGSVYKGSDRVCFSLDQWWCSTSYHSTHWVISEEIPDFFFHGISLRNSRNGHSLLDFSEFRDCTSLTDWFKLSQENSLRNQQIEDYPPPPKRTDHVA